VAARVVPTLNGVNLHHLSRLWVPFLLLNAGCALRVAGQTLTDFTPHAFPIAGVSGLLEVTALALWGWHLWAVMGGRVRPRTAHDPGARIEAGDIVGEVLDHYPELLDTFLALGFRPLANPVLRATVARAVTIAQACRQLGLNPDEVLAALNAARPPVGARSYPLPMVTAS
jgi:hypothetical protein